MMIKMIWAAASGPGWSPSAQRFFRIPAGYTPQSKLARLCAVRKHHAALRMRGGSATHSLRCSTALVHVKPLIHAFELAADVGFKPARASLTARKHARLSSTVSSALSAPRSLACDMNSQQFTTHRTFVLLTENLSVKHHAETQWIHALVNLETKEIFRTQAHLASLLGVDLQLEPGKSFLAQSSLNLGKCSASRGCMLYLQACSTLGRTSWQGLCVWPAPAAETLHVRV